MLLKIIYSSILFLKDLLKLSLFCGIYALLYYQITKLLTSKKIYYIMRDVIRQFTKNLDMVSFLDENNSLCISELARMLSIPYSTAYVRIHKLEEAGLVQLEYLSGKKTVKLTETALELIDAMKTLESEE